MLFSAAAAFRMLKIEQLYNEIKSELNGSFSSKGIVTYHFSALFAYLSPILKDKYPPPLGLILSPFLFENIEGIVPWDFYTIEKPENPNSYIAISANLEKELAVNTLKCCLKQKSLGVVQRIGTHSDSIMFNDMDESVLKQFLLKYKSSRDY